MSFPQAPPPPVPPHSEKRGPDRASTSPTAAIYLSAFVLPGLGQFLQRRWIVGTIFSVTFLVIFVAFLAYALLGILIPYYSFMDFQAEINPSPPLRELLLTGAAGCGVWFLNLIDVFLAHVRCKRSSGL
ncbi:MAG: hypothetical protein K9N51_11445 [Candidatus Pacebacteria bacterium]|nr:hypothetical protein [Candidatus Paceibacterota bacterium]